VSARRDSKSALRPDTVLAPAGAARREVYVYELPVCCLKTLKEAVVAGDEDGRRRLALECGCGRGWWVTSSLDERVLGAFVTHAGPRAGTGSGPSAA
jgi:hypothetical protein